ncbi:serine hydrolase [Streptomyces sp. NPDC048441]|uniref:serine hydrolase n=1 Tax=Streptomyces sp. NPDC048441 TaxID=3365552 RepID=UPI0037119217
MCAHLRLLLLHGRGRADRCRARADEDRDGRRHADDREPQARVAVRAAPWRMRRVWRVAVRPLRVRHGRPQGRPMDHPSAPDGPYWNLRGNGGMLSTARDMFRWHRALTGDSILSAAAKRKLFAPRVRVPELDGAYGYDWVVVDSDDGRVAWHDGGNDWSLATVAEFRRDGIMVFWVSNHACQKGRWNLQDAQLKLTQGVAERV